MNDRIRTFIALTLPTECRNALGRIQQQLRSLPCDVRWEQEEKFHITLKFLGDTPLHRIDTLQEHLRNQLTEFPPLTLAFTKLGAFPSLHAPRVVWVGIANDEIVQPLYNVIERTCTALGFLKEEKQFHPHVTLGRVKGNRNLHRLTEAIKTSTFDTVLCHCNHVALVKSDLRPEGSVYTIIQTFILQRS